MAKFSESISLVIPAYNEEKRIYSVLKNYVSFLEKEFSDYELIVACNNCSDETPEIVKSFAEKNKKVKALNFPFFTGKGGAVKKGFEVASKELIGFVDADESTSPKEFRKIVSALLEKNAGAAIGSRALPESVLSQRQPFFRQFVGKSFGAIVNLLFGLGVRDTQCGAKLFRKKALKQILPQLKLDGWEFDVEILWRLKKSGFSIAEVPIEWRNDPNSKIKPWSALEMFLGLLRLRFFG
ncbi:MAG: dolichyl-phosphate beta-glucosyltransferase [Candidatus Diapherotrites archaeon]